MIFFLSIYALGILGYIIHILTLTARERGKAKLIELLLLYQLVFSVGITSLVAFGGFTFLGQYIADLTGWPASPFEQELANVNLAFAVLGILSIWYRDLFWMATVIGFSIWILGDAIHHFYHFIVAHNATSGNIGVPFFTDLIIPILLLILLYFHRKNQDVAGRSTTISHEK